jgi:hypothetical protein
MMTYEQLQEKGVQAFRNYYEQQRRAAYILDSIAKMCVDVLGFPAGNVAFRATADDEDKKLRPKAAYVIDRDNLGKWNACMSLQVNTDTASGIEPIKLGQSAGGTLLTYIFFEIFFREGVAELSLRGDNRLTVEISHLPGANKTQFDSVLECIAERAASTSDWFGHGTGEKLPIGFGGAKPTEPSK